MALFRKNGKGKHAKSVAEADDNTPTDTAAETDGTSGDAAADDAQDGDAAAGGASSGTQEEAPGAEDASAASDAGATIAIDPVGTGAGEDDAGQGSADDEPAGTVAAAQDYPPFPEAAGPNAYVAAAYLAPKRKRRRALKAFGITAGVLLGVALIAYIAGAIVFMGRFLPNTAIGSKDISMKSDQEVAQMLDAAVANYQLDVLSGSFTYRTTGAQLNMAVDSDAIVAAMHEDLNAWTWPMLLFQPSHDESERLTVTYDRQALAADFSEKAKAFNENANPPVNATIAYDEASKSFQVKPEEIGTQINADAAMALIDQALLQLQAKVTLTDEQLVQPTLLSTDEKLVESARIATGLVSADVKLNMDGKQVGEVTGQSLAGFVTIDDKLEVNLNEEALDNWISDLANSYNTIGTERHFTRADGKEISVGGGEYGWDIDTDALKEQLLEAVKTGAATTIDVPLYQEAAVYNGQGERDWGNRYIDVDLSEQYVRFYGDDGSIIWESACITGAPDGKHETGLGVWYINNKESPSKLIGYENGKKQYETMVSYWMAFEYSGIGLHDATWQPSFGGNMYANGYGSHGCVNLPYSAAQELYGICTVGDVVIVHW